MDNNCISEKLKELAASKNRPAIARLRDIFDDIEAALHAGVRRKDIHKTLNESGFKITFESFELAIYRIRKDRCAEKKQKVEVKAASPNVLQPSSPAAITTSNDDLIRPAGVTDARWSEIKAEKRTKARNQKLNQVS